ncbi:unnamed protein product, partial [Allacma fusca]
MELECDALADKAAEDARVNKTTMKEPKSKPTPRKVSKRRAGSNTTAANILTILKERTTIVTAARNNPNTGSHSTANQNDEPSEDQLESQAGCSTSLQNSADSSRNVKGDVSHHHSAADAS